MVLKHRVIVGCGLGVAAAAIAGVVGSAGALRGFEHFTWDQRARTLATPADPKIKLILLDQPSLDWSERVNNLAWPWPREVYVPIIEFCRRAGVRSIAFDVLYTEPSAYGVEDDMALGAAIAATPSFVCAVQPLRDGDAVRWPDAAAAGFLQVKGLDRWSRSVRRAGAVLPCAAFAVDEIAERVAMHAHVRGVIDRDNVIRRALPLVVLDERAVPMLGLAAYMNGAVAGDRAPPVMTIGPRWLHVGGRRLPLDEGGRTILRYRRPKEEARHAYEAYSAAAVIESQLQLAEGRAPSIDPGTFRDCYVLFGFNAPGLYDYHPTPFHKAAPGVAIHATLLDNLLNNDAIAVAPAPPVVLFILATAMAAGLWSVLSRSARQLVAGFVLFGPLPAVAGAITYVWGYQWPVVAPQLALTLSLVGGVIVNYATEGRQRRFIKRAFQHYLSPAVIERVLEDPSRLKLGGERREVSIFFADLQGFSTISERLDPHTLTCLLNDYLTDMTDIILDTGGTLDKYEGDAIVAFWNAPLDQPDHALLACRAVLRCQRVLAERRADLEARASAPIRMRIGVHTGDAIVGNMGSHSRFDYTVLGDAANLAAHLEGANKRFGTGGMVSESTWKSACGNCADLVGRPIGLVRVVGRDAPVMTYEPLGFTADVSADKGFERAHALCRDLQWQAALVAFEALPDDPLVQTYRRKLCEVLGNGQVDWDGVWNLTEK